jgi:hypothetical protein
LGHKGKTLPNPDGGGSPTLGLLEGACACPPTAATTTSTTKETKEMHFMMLPEYPQTLRTQRSAGNLRRFAQLFAAFNVYLH